MLEAPIFRCHSTLEETKQTRDHAQLFRLSLSSRTRASFTVSCAGPGGSASASSWPRLRGAAQHGTEDSDFWGLAGLLCMHPLLLRLVSLLTPCAVVQLQTRSRSSTEVSASSSARAISSRARAISSRVLIRSSRSDTTFCREREDCIQAHH